VPVSFCREHTDAIWHGSMSLGCETRRKGKPTSEPSSGSFERNVADARYIRYEHKRGGARQCGEFNLACVRIWPKNVGRSCEDISAGTQVL
jgi:hypothetical protein